VKKPAKPVEDEALAIPEEEAPIKVRSKDLQVAHRTPTPQRKKLLVFNVHGTLLDSSLLLDKIRPRLYGLRLELVNVELYSGLGS
jgi:hypothetical protein